MKINFKAKTFDALMNFSRSKKIPITKLVEIIIDDVALNADKLNNLIEEETNEQIEQSK